jgi:hypothetical protein
MYVIKYKYEELINSCAFQIETWPLKEEEHGPYNLKKVCMSIFSKPNFVLVVM